MAGKTIDEVVINTKERLLAVAQYAVRETIRDAQKTKREGGKMRVDTGFLRISGVASVNQLPIGPTRGRQRLPGEESKPLVDYVYDGQPVAKVLNDLKIGDDVYFGWTAKYARVREFYDGFLESALMNWRKHVDTAVAKFRDKDMKS
jgi:hypothetical protein